MINPIKTIIPPNKKEILIYGNKPKYRSLISKIITIKNCIKLKIINFIFNMFHLNPLHIVKELKEKIKVIIKLLCYFQF